MLTLRRSAARAMYARRPMRRPLSSSAPFLSSFLPKPVEGKPGLNRWLMMIPAVSNHVVLGSVYAASVLLPSYCRELGVVAPAAGDWGMSEVVPTFAAIVCVQGLSAAVLGAWQDRVGYRASGTLGAFVFGSGFLVGSAGLLAHSLPALYLGYGLIAGCGIGLAYVPPVAELLRWFPDRRGLATGLTIMGYGGGALLAAPLKERLLEFYQRAPDYVGPADAVRTVLRGGRRFAETREVVEATAQELTANGWHGLEPGLYAVGTGSTGTAATLATFGTLGFAVMAASALSFRSAPAGSAASASTPAPRPAPEAISIPEGRSVTASAAMRTPQFWALWCTFGTMTTAGMAVVSVAKTMVTEIFGSLYPGVVTGTAFVMALSVGNLSGRVGWAALSDRIGRRRMFAIATALSVPMYLCVPYLVTAGAAAGATVVPLAGFVGATVIAFSVYGAGFAATPPYEADLFGGKHVGAIHGRLMTASSVAALCGPFLITWQRERAIGRAIESLAAVVDDVSFERAFGGPKSDIVEMVSAKHVTIERLLAVAPPGTADPTPFLYNDFFVVAGGFLTVAFLANAAVRPVSPRHFEAVAEKEPEEEEGVVDVEGARK